MHVKGTIPLFTPRLFGVRQRWENAEMDYDDRRGPGFKGYVTNEGKRYAIHGASCGIDTCYCDAIVIPVPAHGEVEVRLVYRNTGRTARRVKAVGRGVARLTPMQLVLDPRSVSVWTRRGESTYLGTSLKTAYKNPRFNRKTGLPYPMHYGLSGQWTVYVQGKGIHVDGRRV